VAYRLMYRVGFTPWEQGAVMDPTLVDLLDREQANGGRALDLGSGTGRNTIELARRGWDAVGVELEERALERARQRPVSGTARFVRGDVTRLGSLGIGTGFGLVLDRGCFHGLDDEQRGAVAAEVTRLATPDAVLLMFAFARTRSLPFLPKGAEPPDVEAAYAGWRLTDVIELDAATLPPAPRTLGLVPRWMRLQRG
jgi:SAM-dependent methyltransferase